MTIVIDTSVLVDHLRGDERARSVLRGAAQGGQRLCASVVTKVEIFAGMRPNEEQFTRHLLGSLDLIEVDDALAEGAGMLANRYLRSHPGVDRADYIIAATTQQLGADLWTRNLKHFPIFPWLSSPY